ncbi:cupin domain-containing protein, partial [Alishewanella sp. SMS9]|nr:cupin domain-containing protein [Alishewanella sp. SMS9]
MQVNNDFSQRVVVRPSDYRFVASPLAGVSRMMLDRAGAEVARATSIVRYAAGAGYTSHRHDGGEEIFVLEGIFSDEHGDYPAGTYLRNPPGSSHQPFSREGCTLLVKLWQFAADDTTQLVKQTASASWYQGMVPGLSVLPLHEHDGINTALVRWAPNTQFNPHT